MLTPENNKYRENVDVSNVCALAARNTGVLPRHGTSLLLGRIADKILDRFVLPRSNSALNALYWWGSLFMVIGAAFRTISATLESDVSCFLLHMVAQIL